jgi:hypothetical protein
MSLDPSGPDALSLKDLNTFQPLRKITLTKTASPPAEAWGGWETFAGYLTQGLAVASWDENRLDVFSAGLDQALHHKWWNASGGWSSGWERLDGTFSGKPAAASWGQGRLDICVVGTDNAVWHRSFDNGTWSGWDSLGGVVQSGVGATSGGSGQLDVVACGIDNNIYIKSFRSGSGWTGWQKVLSFATSAPDVVAYSQNELTLACVGGGNNLYFNNSVNSVFGGWQNADGSCLDVTMASWGPYFLNFIVRGTDTQIYEKRYVDGSPGNWQYLGGSSPCPLAACSRYPGNIELFAIGTDRALWHRSYG